VKTRILAVVLLAFLPSACTPVMDAVVQTARTAAQGGPGIDLSLLNPKFHYLRVTVENRVAFLVLGFLDNHPQGRIEVWYSGQKEAVRLLNGRLIGAVGLATEWRGVVLPDLPSWSAMARSEEPMSWVRVRDVMPGYRFGMRDALVLRPISAPEKTALLNLDPKALTWFEERFQTGPLAGNAVLRPTASSDDRVLPPARYAVDLRDGGETVVYGEQCLSPDFCFTWQRWDFHVQPPKP
jgi:hypothetical protein